MVKWKIYNQDVVAWAHEYKKGKFHALLCDPPYHLTTIVKRFGKKGSAPAKFGTDGVFARSSAGFMGQDWDGGDVAFDPATWAAFHDVLYPGAFGMAFSASRNWHRLAVAIEDAGYIIHPTIFLWIQGQGFPKATNISKQLAKISDDWDMNPNVWEGHRYGLQALKPAVEPIIVFQKPYEGKPLDNIVETGAGALNIDASRIATNSPVTINRFKDGAKPWGNGAGHEYETELTEQGRWPSNLILEEGSAKALDAQTGTLKSGKPSGNRNTGGGYHGHYGVTELTGFGDEGGASRFFYVVQDKIDDADPAYYCGKVSKKERNAGTNDNKHPTLKPIDLARYLATLLLPPDEYKPRRIFVPFSGTMSEAIGAGLAGWEQIVAVESDTKNGYIEIGERRMRYWMSKK